MVGESTANKLLRARPWVLPRRSLRFALERDEVFDAGKAPSAVCEMGMEGVVAKRTASRFGAAVPDWASVENPS